MGGTAQWGKMQTICRRAAQERNWSWRSRGFCVTLVFFLGFWGFRGLGVRGLGFWGVRVLTVFRVFVLSGLRS